MPELIHQMTQPEGWLVIDSTINGRSHGGLRISETTGLEELKLLARMMTLKFGFLGLSSGGGAKAGIRGNPETDPATRMAILRKFSASLGNLVKTGAFVPHPDMGTNEIEIQQAFALNRSRKLPGRENSGYYTALGVITAASVAFRMRGRNWPAASIAVEGFGKVGSAVARLAAERGAKVTGISTSFGGLCDPDGLPVIELLRAAASRGGKFVLDFPAKQIARAEILKLPVDLLSPCANSGTIHSANAGSINAAIVCAGANCPLTPEARQSLTSRNVWCLPDFLTSSGGVLGGTLAFAGLNAAEIEQLLTQSLDHKFTTIFEMSWLDAEKHCAQRFERMKEAAEQGGLKRKFFDFGLNLFRKGFLPQLVVSRFAPGYFRKVLS